MKQDRLKTLFDFLPKSKIKAGDGEEEGKYPFYTSSENQTKYLNEFQNEPGCLVFGTGGKASVHLTTNRFSTSTDCITIRPKERTKIDSGYVFQYFKGNMQVLESGFKGAGLKHISKAYLSNILIPYPESFDEQKRLAHLLRKGEGLIGQRKQTLQQLDDLLKSVFLDSFGDPIRNEKGWDKPQLNQFGKISTGNTPPRKDSSNFSSKHIEWIKTDNISTDSVFISQAAEYLSETGAIKGRTVSGGALLVACIAGSVESIGRAALTDRTIAFNQQINAIQPNKDVNPFYLYVLFKISRTYIRNHASKGMKKILNKGDFEKISMIKPPIDLQNQFAAIVQKIEEIKSGYKQSLFDMKTLYGAMSQKAFNGELDLSRIPLPTENNKAAEEDQVVVEKEQPVEVSIELPAPPNLDILGSLEGRMELLHYWLTVWLDQLGDSSFTAQSFMEAAQQRFLELGDEVTDKWGEAKWGEAKWSGEPNWNAVEHYDELKIWIFEALESGRMTQSYEEGNNRVRVQAPKQ